MRTSRAKVRLFLRIREEHLTGNNYHFNARNCVATSSVPVVGGEIHMHNVDACLRAAFSPVEIVWTEQRSRLQIQANNAATFLNRPDFNASGFEISTSTKIIKIKINFYSTEHGVPTGSGCLA